MIGPSCGAGRAVLPDEQPPATVPITERNPGMPKIQVGSITNSVGVVIGGGRISVVADDEALIIDAGDFDEEDD